MARMRSIFSNKAGSSTNNTVNKIIGSKYDVVKAVADKLDKIETIAVADIEALTKALNEAKDFTGITVEAADESRWDAESKTLYIKTLKGDTGPQGKQGIQGPKGDTGPRGQKGDPGPKGPQGTPGAHGAQGPIGRKGDKGDKGEKGEKGDKGAVGPRGFRGPKGDKGKDGKDGIPVHHVVPTSTTNKLGDFSVAGEQDTYTLYGDADETIVLGYFTITNGKSSLSKEEIAYYYELNPNTNKYTDSEKEFVGIDTPLNTVAATLPSAVNEVLAQLLTEITIRNNAILKSRKAIGLADNGDYVVDTDATYINTATTVHNATQILDSTIKNLSESLVAEYNRAVAKEDAVQLELDVTQKSAGLATDGTYLVPTTSNYLNDSSSLFDALLILDAALKTEEQARSNRDITISNSIGQLSALDTDTKDSITTAINETVTKIISNTEEIENLHTAMANEADKRSAEDISIRSALKDTQTGAGLNTDGSYEPSTKPYIDNANSLKDADDRLADALSNIAVTKFNNTGGLIDGDVEVTGNVTIKGDFTTVSSSVVQVSDKNIELGTTDTPTDTTADGGGITLKGDTDKTIIWRKSSGAWEFSDPIVCDLTLKTGKIIALSGDVEGAVTFTGADDVTIAVNVIDNSHKHVTANIDGLDDKLADIDDDLTTIYKTLDVVKSIQDDLDNIQSIHDELNSIEAGAGLTTDGAYVANPETTYLNEATSLFDADNKLDAVIKKEVDSRKTDSIKLQAQIDNLLNSKEDAVNKVSEWAATPSDTKYPTEKLVKTSLDAQIPNLSADITNTTVTVVSSAGTNAVIPAATGTKAGVLSSADKLKLDTTETSEQLDARDTANRDRTNHVGTQSIDTIVETADKKIFTNIERNKLAGIEDNATADQTGAEIKVLYEAEDNTNAYTDTEKALIDIATALNTEAVTLPAAINELKKVIDTHTADTANPHSVTKDQIGLGNVNNTSDMKKPISEATKAALDLKANIDRVKDIESRINDVNGFATVDSLTLSGVIQKEFGKLPVGYSVEGVTLSEVFKKAYIGEVPPTVHIVDNLDTHLREFGDIVKELTVEIKVTKGSSDKVQVKLLCNKTVENTYTEVTDSIKYTFNDISKDTKLETLVSDEHFNDITSNVISLNFTYPWYAGSGVMDRLDVAGLDKHLKWEDSFTYKFTTDNSTMYLFLPTTLPDITSILDENSLETVSDWEVSAVSIKCMDGSVQKYKRYMFKNVTTMTTKFTFKV